MLHDLQIRCSRGVLSYLPVSIYKLCDEVLKRDRATLYLFSFKTVKYFSDSKFCLKIQYDCKRLELLILLYHC